LSFFSRKINESRTFYELDSSQFSLYYPKKSEIYERVLNELNVYEFENLLIAKPVILKVIGIFFEQNLDLIVQKRALILTKKEENNKRLNYILALEERIKAL
ncbi:ATP-binding protein, partial [Campylobacter upsaliensis]|nr:ATP-binding protein [Campylobacter upsaliensis]